MLATLRYKKHTQDVIDCRVEREGAADGAHGHGLAISLWPAGLGTHPHSRPSLCAHAPRRTDTAPRAGGNVRGAPYPEFHHLPTATVVGLALQEAAPTPGLSYAPE